MTARISGVLIDGFGEPIANAQMRAVSRETGESIVGSTAYTKTGVDGSYDFTLEIGSYSFSIWFGSLGYQYVGDIYVQDGTPDCSLDDALSLPSNIQPMVLTKVLQAAIDAQSAADSAAEEVRSILIPLSRQYMTLAAAQADIANIPVGSTTYYRSPDDSALAIEVMNVDGTLTATGRKMPSYDMVAAISQAVTAEVMARTGLIFSGGGQAILSLCDEWGYEAGRITESSFETRKLKLVQSDTGPLLMLADDFGYALSLFSEKGALVAGGNEISDSESLISFPDEFGNELILVDKQGRLRAGDATIFETPDWARCTVDSFGYVIEGVKLNGDVVSKNGGGGSVEPVPSVLESSATAHWLFGYESTSYASRVGYKTLTPQAAPEFNSNYISVPAWGGALMTDIPDAAEYTVCAVVRVPEQDPLTDCVVIYGTQNGYSLRDDDDTYTGNQLSMFSDRDDRRWIRSKQSGYRGTSRHYPTLQPPVGQWIFVSHVVKLGGNGMRYQAMGVGGEEYQMLREADADRLILSGRNIAIGNGWCDNAMFKTKNLDIAEFIYFDRPLSAQQVQAVYRNSRQRMAERSLNLQ
nr:tail fiber protein [Klebsiella phage vB_Kpn_K21lambda1]